MEETASFFHIFVTGQIELAEFPMGPDGSEVFCRYDVVAGPDWELLSGLKTGITQTSLGKNGSQEIVFNMPIEFSYKSTNPFGWPQIVFSVYGKNCWGTETSLGYARAHVPIFGKNSSLENKIYAPILIPRSSNLFAEFSSWLTGKNPEFKNPQILVEGLKNKNLQTESYGQIVISLQTISRGSTRMGYDWGQG